MYSSKLSYFPLDINTESKPVGSRRKGLQLVQHTPQGQLPVISSMDEPSKGLFTSIHSYGQENSAPKKSQRVLQVEDNSENRFIVHRYLRNDYQYESVNEGEQALQLLENEDFDAIIMDINLGAGIDGIETARQIRKNSKYDNIAIIAVTANVSLEIKDECMEAGMDAFLPKPFRKSELKETIEYALQNRSNI